MQNQIEQYLKNSISEEKKKGQNKSKKVKGSTSLLHTTIWAGFSSSPLT